MEKLRIDIWSDIACPWCFVGKRRLEAALARFPHHDRVEVIWRAFELDPSAPRERTGGVSHTARVAAKYGRPVAEMEKTIRDDLYAHLQRFVNPSPFGINQGIEYLFVAVVGGAGSV